MGKITVTRTRMPDFEEYCREIAPLWESCWVTNMGEKHRAFQQELEQRLGCCVTLFCNGHLALENALAALHLPAGAEVITTPFTFASTTHAIVRQGLTPVFCEIREEDYTLDPEKLENLVTGKTAAILPVHVYGNLCDVERIDAFGKAHDLRVIYDAAHAFGVKYRGQSAACFGDMSMFSFHATKVFHTVEGGAVCFREERWRQRLDDGKNFGIRALEEVAEVGGNAKMNELQAAMGICNLRHLDAEIAGRKRVSERYRENLGGLDGIRLCAQQAETEPNYAYFPVVLEGDRERVYQALREQDILVRKYFYPLTSDFPCYAHLPSAGGDKTPVAKWVSDHVLTLPLYGELSLEDADRISEIVIKNRE